MRIFVDCDSGHQRTQMSYSEHDQSYRCIVRGCGQLIGRERVMMLIPPGYKPSDHWIINTLQQMADYDVVCVVNYYNTTIEYPRAGERS